MTQELPDDKNIECPYQAIGMGQLICKCADTTQGKHSTNESSEITCYNCPAGKIYREVGCDSFSAKVHLLDFTSKITIENILCKKRKRSTDLEYCRTCSLVTAPTTKEIISTATGLFQSDKFYSAYKHIEDARRDLRDANYDGAITSSVSCLESTMKIILDRLNKPYPSAETLGPLWKSVKEALALEEIVSSESVTPLLGTLTGSLSHLGGMRNKIGDAHGKGELVPDVPYMLAELAINTASTLSTLLIRRYHERGGK
jgi:hypothetical protein